MSNVNYEITWPVDEGILFLGRNGAGKCSGLWITHVGDYITLRPLTSRNNLAKCSIDIPRNQLKRLAEILSGLAKA